MHNYECTVRDYTAVSHCASILHGNHYLIIVSVILYSIMFIIRCTVGSLGKRGINTLE